MDGLGGTVKRAVWRHVRSGHVHVSNPEEYAAVAQQRNPNTGVSPKRGAEAQRRATQLKK